jgi:hypothetical protein
MPAEAFWMANPEKVKSAFFYQIELEKLVGCLGIRLLNRVS